MLRQEPGLPGRGGSEGNFSRWWWEHFSEVSPGPDTHLTTAGSSYRTFISFQVLKPLLQTDGLVILSDVPHEESLMF